MTKQEKVEAEYEKMVKAMRKILQLTCTSSNSASEIAEDAVEEVRTALRDGVYLEIRDSSDPSMPYYSREFEAAMRQAGL